MRYSQAFIPTLKEVPKDAITPSHILLLRGGYVRMVGAGIYEMLPLGFRVLTNIAAVVREEMNRSGAQEVLMPALLPREYFEESGRWDSFGDTLMRLRDRKHGDYHLGPTHEEIVTDMVRRDVRSYRQLPLNLYQIQMKFRDEARPRAGLLRCREFMMKDAYSFDVSEARALESYEQMRAAYHRIFRRLGLEYRVVSADSGAMGGSTSAEFQVLAQNGEDAIVACTNCDYAANVEVATATSPERSASEAAAMDRVSTPGAKTIEEVATLLRIDPRTTIKALFFRASREDGVRYALVFLRGDHEANEVKVARVLGARELSMATADEVARHGGVVGFIGPQGEPGWSGLADLDVVIDRALDTGEGFVAGGNEVDVHVKNVVVGRDVEVARQDSPGTKGLRVVDVRTVGDGDGCPNCGHPLKSYRGIEGGHVFVLGTHYTEKMRCTFLDDEGHEKPIVMGCYGIGVSRLVATTVEQHHDADGIAWPMSIAPYQVVITPAGKGDELDSAATELYRELVSRGAEVLLDDRDERPGVKFKDADLVGIPLRVTIGKKGLAEGIFEVKARRDKEADRVPVAEVAEAVVQRIRNAGGRLRTVG